MKKKNIGRILSTIINQRIRQSFEVQVVCSGCTDRTVEVAEAFSKVDSRINVIIEKKRVGKPTAINKIIKNAKGSYICFISADTLTPKRLFDYLVNRLEASDEVGVVCGRPIPLNGKRTK